jgi:hypothetical protein
VSAGRERIPRSIDAQVVAGGWRVVVSFEDGTQASVDVSDPQSLAAHYGLEATHDEPGHRIWERPRSV